MSPELLVGVLSLVAAVLALPKIGIKRFFVWATVTVVVLLAWSWFRPKSTVADPTHVSKSAGTGDPNTQPRPDSAAIKKPEPTLHDTDESGIRYHVTWSVDANCTGWQRQVAAHPELVAGHSCDFTHTQVKIGESKDPFDHWNVAVQAPGGVYDVDCQRASVNFLKMRPMATITAARVFPKELGGAVRVISTVATIR